MLRKHRVYVENLSVYETFGGCLEIELSAKTWYGRFVTTREVAQILSQNIGCGFQVEESCRKYLNREVEPFLCIQCPALRTSMGVARAAKETDSVSGDTFSCIELKAGELFFALSDGMGSGEQAFSESSGMIELLEQMMASKELSSKGKFSQSPTTNVAFGMFFFFACSIIAGVRSSPV